jgi:NADPH2:quinone reductase
MRAAWYDHRGPARDTLVVGEVSDPEPGEGEVRIALTTSGISPGDVKKRAVWLGSSEMAFQRVIPHSDGAGTIDVVGSGVDPGRAGERVWCYGAQSYRPFGTAADYVVVPDALAVKLRHQEDSTDAELLDQQASCLGIPGITAHRAVFADGPVEGLVVLVYGAAGGVGSIATQLARLDGAAVIAVVRDDDQAARVRKLGPDHVFLDGEPRLEEHIRDAAPDGVNRVAEVDFAAHIEINADILAIGGTISSFATSVDRPAIPYWDLGFKDTTIRLLGSDDFSPAVKDGAAKALTEAVIDGGLRSDVVAKFPLEEIASAHEMVEGGAAGRVVLDMRMAQG